MDKPKIIPNGYNLQERLARLLCYEAQSGENFLDCAVTKCDQCALNGSLDNTEEQAQFIMEVLRGGV